MYVERTGEPLRSPWPFARTGDPGRPALGSRLEPPSLERGRVLWSIERR